MEWVDYGPAPKPKRTPKTNGRSAELPFAWRSVPGKILTVLIQHKGNGLKPRRVAALAGVRFGHSTWRNALAKLRKQALMVERDDGFAASQDAIEKYAWAVPPLPSGKDLIVQWRKKLGGVPLRILDLLLAADDEGLTKEEIESELGDMPSSTKRNAMAKLRRNGLIGSALRAKRIRLGDHVLTARKGSRAR